MSFGRHVLLSRRSQLREMFAMFNRSRRARPIRTCVTCGAGYRRERMVRSDPRCPNCVALLDTPEVDELGGGD
jgi:hypothetical protein